MTPTRHVLEVVDRPHSHVLLQCSCGHWRRVLSAAELQRFSSVEAVRAAFEREHEHHAETATRPRPPPPRLGADYYA